MDSVIRLSKNPCEKDEKRKVCTYEGDGERLEVGYIGGAYKGAFGNYVKAHFYYRGQGITFISTLRKVILMSSLAFRAAERGRTFRVQVPSVRSGSLIMILTAVMDLTQGHLTSNPLISIGIKESKIFYNKQYNLFRNRIEVLRVSPVKLKFFTVYIKKS